MKKKRHRYLSAAERKRLRQGAGKSGTMRLALELGLAGLRASEIVAARWGDVEGDLLNVIGKGDKHRQIPITPSLKAILDGSRNGTDRMVPMSRVTLWRWIKKLATSVSVKNIFPHTLRHTCAAMYLNSGKLSIYQVSQLLGHSSIQLTCDLYGHLDVQGLARGMLEYEKEEN